MKRIPVSGPSITDREVFGVLEAVRHGWYERAHEWPGRFEAAMALATGMPFAVSLPSCTSAIHLALYAAGIGPDDEVIVPELTWIATVAPIAYVGAKPVFADVEPDTWCLSAKTVEACLTPRTKAVIAVDLYGAMPDYRALKKLLDARGIVLIEDAAEAIGSKRGGHIAGSAGAFGVFSFHGSKTVTTGEGGMLLLRDEATYKRVLSLREHGRPQGGRLFWNEEIGFKYRMSSMQAALGIAQLERLDELVAIRRKIFGWYKARLGDLAAVRLNAEPPDLFHSVWMVTALTPGVAKEDLISWMADGGIDTRPVFYPLSMLPALSKAEDTPRAQRENVVAKQISACGLNLPTAPILTESDVDRVCQRLLQGLAKLRAMPKAA